MKNVPRARDAVTRPLARRRRGDSSGRVRSSAVVLCSSFVRVPEPDRARPPLSRATTTDDLLARSSKQIRWSTRSTRTFPSTASASSSGGARTRPRERAASRPPPTAPLPFFLEGRAFVLSGESRKASATPPPSRARARRRARVVARVPARPRPPLRPVADVVPPVSTSQKPRVRRPRHAHPRPVDVR